MLEYFLTQLGQSAFIFQIEAQDVKLTNYLKGRGVFHASNGWKVTLDVEPEIDIDNKIIYLQGSNSELDHKIDRHWDLKGKELKDTIKNINNALKETVEAAKTVKRNYEVRVIDQIVIRPGLTNVFESFRNAYPEIIILR